jgi:hypothetical protein
VEGEGGAVVQWIGHLHMVQEEGFFVASITIPYFFKAWLLLLKHQQLSQLTVASARAKPPR